MKRSLLLVSIPIVALAGCGAGPSPTCTPKPYLTVSPMAATIDHTAAPPQNQVQFLTTESENFYLPSGQFCAVPAVVAIVHPIWTNPQPQQISISSANDSTNGIAVCTAATDGPVTLTGTVNGTLIQGSTGNIPAQPLTITVQMLCN